MFGSDVERCLGSTRYVTYYFVCVIAAALAQLTISSVTGGDYPTVGASGGIFGLLLAFAIFFPERVIMPLFPPIPMPARIFVFVYGGLELVLGVTGSQAGVAHFAHLGGMLGGYLSSSSGGCNDGWATRTPTRGLARTCRPLAQFNGAGRSRCRSVHNHTSPRTGRKIWRGIGCRRVARGRSCPTARSDARAWSALLPALPSRYAENPTGESIL
jgi:hypothetical protein